MLLSPSFGIGVVDPQSPLEPSRNRGVVAEWSVIPTGVKRGGLVLRDLTRGCMAAPSDGAFNSSVPPVWRGNALRFESSTTGFTSRTNYVEVPDANKLDLVTTFSIDFYANFDAFSGGTECGTIVSKFNAGGQAGIRLEGASSGTLLVTSGGSNVISVTGASAIIAGLHHHCLVSNGSGSTYYVDGKSIGTGSSLSTWFSNANVLRIGAPAGSFYGSGDFSAAFLLYGMRFANVAWDLAEVQAACQEWKTGNPNRWNWINQRAAKVTAASGTTLTPSTASLVTTGFSPTVTATANQTATPNTLALTLTTFAPTVATPVAVTPSTASLSLTTFAPTVTAGGNQSVTPDTLALTLTTFAPTVAAGGNQSATPTTASLTLTTFAPTVSTPVAVTPSTLALSLTTFEPTVTVSGSASVTPGTLALVLTMYAPTVTGGEDIGGLVCGAATITTRVAGTPSITTRITGSARLTECC